MCKWSGEEENWESKTKDSASFPYHRDTILIADTAKDTTKKKSPKDLEEPSLPDVVKKRLCIPFEFRFINQDVSNSHRLNKWLCLGDTRNSRHSRQLSTLRSASAL